MVNWNCNPGWGGLGASSSPMLCGCGLLACRYGLSKVVFPQLTTFSDGCLGSGIDEGRSEVRYAL